MVPSKSCDQKERKEQLGISNRIPTSSSQVSNPEPKESVYRSASFANLSPCSRGVANLLTDMKSTNCSIRGRSLLDPNFSLGQSAVSSTVSSNESHQSNRTLSPTTSISTTHSSHQGNSPTGSISNDLYVTKQRSMSLLGRVQHFPKPLKMRTSSSAIIDSTSAFFWPPRKTTIGSPSHTAVTFESSTTSSPSPPNPYLQTDIDGTKKPQVIDKRQKSRQRTESSLSIGNGMEETGDCINKDIANRHESL